MDFQQLADVAEKWCSNTPFELIATEETERRMDFYADPGVSFYVLCPDNGCGDNFLAQDYISSCGKKTLQEVLEKVFKSFRPKIQWPLKVREWQLLLPISHLATCLFFSSYQEDRLPGPWVSWYQQHYDQ
ncbi:maturin isoform X4 [Myotis myotis]|uniref:maturin isoform X4 n=1 Tax=Myotis myotis TaxID=51298 RepID=UPI00174A9920|nr:maturin isoform X4 [Myotis myotis]